MSFFTVNCLNRTQISSDILALTLEKPFDFQAGQYLCIQHGDKSHPYSIASTPGTSTLTLHIQHSERRPLSSAFWRYLNETPTLRISEPLGEAYLRTKSRRPLIFIAGGSGFAPISSMIDSLAQARSQREIYLYWGVQHEQLLYDQERVSQWKTHLTHFHFIPVIFEPKAAGLYKTGFVHEAVLADHPDLKKFDIYIAGPFALTHRATADFYKKHGTDLTVYSDAN